MAASSRACRRSCGRRRDGEAEIAAMRRWPTRRAHEGARHEIDGDGPSARVGLMARRLQRHRAGASPTDRERKGGLWPRPDHRPLAPAAGELRITVQGMRSSIGTVLIGLYDSAESFNRAIDLSDK